MATLLQWIVASVKKGTFDLIRSVQPHLIALQEIRKPLPNTPSYNYISCVRGGGGGGEEEGEDAGKGKKESLRQGGGVAVGVERSLTYRDLSALIPPSLSELEAVFVQVVHECFELFLLNVYVSHYQHKCKLLAPLSQWLASIMARKPQAIYLVCGDFNSAKKPIHFLHDLLPLHLTTFRRLRLLTRLVGTEEIWYKLYADDLVLIVSHTALSDVLQKLRQAAADYGLIVNESKSAIFAVKGHGKLCEEQSIDGIPIIDEYCYLGVHIDDRGTIGRHLLKLRQRSAYLRHNLRHYARHLLFRNQYMLWAVYVQPYFHYVAPIMHTQTKTVREAFHRQWRMSLKQFIRLPASLPSFVLDLLLKDTTAT
jgi:hypothetical protein